MATFIKNIIPSEYKVLPEYFFESEIKVDNSSFIKWILSAAIFGACLFSFKIDIYFTFCLFLTSFVISPIGHKFLENLLSFKFNNNLLLKFLAFISVFTLITGNNFRKDLAEINENNRILEQKKLAAIKENEVKEQTRKDSLNYFISIADKLQNKGQFLKSIEILKQAEKYSKNNDLIKLSLMLGDAFFSLNNFKKANIYYEKINSGNPEFHYRKGYCIYKTGEIQLALYELNNASNGGIKQAEELYNKINPLIRKVLYYQTVCCDGTNSPTNAKGRGACSHHGGVCNWNKPIYEEYRKYEVSNF